MKIVTIEQMRRLEQECARFGVSTSQLMENAGKAVAEEVERILSGIPPQQHIVILIGPGNNGGDGLVAARYLHEWGAKVSIFLASQRPPDDSNLKLVLQRGITIIDDAQAGSLDVLSEELSSAYAVIDALFGTGKSRVLSGVFSDALNRVMEAKKKNPRLYIIALDLPSGLNADTGAVDSSTPHADHTITLGFPKPGLFKFPGAEYAGKRSIVDIGIPAQLAEEVTLELITDKWAKAVLPQRPLNANKGSFGKVMAAAGSINYIGAAYLACNGAMRAGAGLVTLATASSLQPVLAAKLTEVTYLPLPESEPGIISARAASTVRRQLKGYNVLLIGCGLGQSLPATSFVKSILLKSKSLPSMVIDADALNILAKIPKWWQRLTGDAILTPHPGEMARLTGISIDEVQTDRTGTAQKAAREWGMTVVLKGAFTVIASPDGRCRISPIANAGLASAGTGDVLAGAIAGLAAQGLSLFDAAALGVHLHGKAGEIVKEQLGDTGMIASDLLPALPLAIKRLKEGDRCC